MREIIKVFSFCIQWLLQIDEFEDAYLRVLERELIISGVPNNLPNLRECVVVLGRSRKACASTFWYG